MRRTQPKPEPQQSARRLHALASARALAALLRPALLLVPLLLWPDPAAHAAAAWYDVDYRVRFAPAAGEAEVTIVVTPDGGRPTRLDYAMDERRYTEVRGDGALTHSDGRAIWLPPKAGGTLRYRYQIDHRRNTKGYDARITADWAILRGDDLFPPARVRTTNDAQARATLRFELPEQWSAVETQYLPRQGDETPASFVIDNPERRFVRPTGWIIAGDLDVHREVVGDATISVAAPRGLAYPHRDILRTIQAAAPELRRLGRLPPKLLVVGSGDPMWRGGLSATRSLWMHAVLPLVSRDGTSTLIHELVHVVTRLRGTSDHDWIAEGLAEYYALEVPFRTGLITERQRDETLQQMRRRGQAVQSLRAPSSFGARTARAVTLFADLDRAIRDRTANRRALDDVVRQLADARRGRVSPSDLQRAVEHAQGAPSPLLDGPLVR